MSKSGAGNRAGIYFPPPPCPVDASPFDFSQTGRLIERARESTAAGLDAGGLDREPHPLAYCVHGH